MRKKNIAQPLSSPFFSPGFCLFFESSSYPCRKYKIAILRRKCTEEFANSLGCSKLQNFPSKYALCPWRGFALCPASPAPETLLTQGICYVPYKSDNWLVSVPQSSLQHHSGKHHLAQGVGRQAKINLQSRAK